MDLTDLRTEGHTPRAVRLAWGWGPSGFVFLFCEYVMHAQQVRSNHSPQGKNIPYEN